MNDDEHDLVEAILAADLETMLPRLATYAQKRLRRVGWFSSETRESHKMNPKELVDLAIQRCLAGERHWRKDSPYPDLESFLRGVIKSLLSSAVKADSRDVAGLADDGNVDRLDTSTDIAADGEHTLVVEAISCCAQDDEDLTAFYLTVLDGHTKREDIATALGWDVARATAARVKLQRRLEKRHPELFATLKKRRAS